MQDRLISAFLYLLVVDLVLHMEGWGWGMHEGQYCATHLVTVLAKLDDVNTSLETEDILDSRHLGHA